MGWEWGSQHTVKLKEIITRLGEIALEQSWLQWYDLSAYFFNCDKTWKNKRDSNQKAETQIRKNSSSLQAAVIWSTTRGGNFSFYSTMKKMRTYSPNNQTNVFLITMTSFFLLTLQCLQRSHYCCFPYFHFKLLISCSHTDPWLETGRSRELRNIFQRALGTQQIGICQNWNAENVHKTQLGCSICELLGASQISSEYNLYESLMRWALNSSKFCPSWLRSLLLFLHLITIAIIVQKTSYGNDLIGFKTCSKGKCHRCFGPIPHFFHLEADYSNSRKKMSFLLPYGKLNATVKETLK